MVQDFEDLRIYQQARALGKQVYEITRNGEFKNDTRFVQQIRAAVGSIADNIAEGFERQGNKEYKQFRRNRQTLWRGCADTNLKTCC